MYAFRKAELSDVEALLKLRGDFMACFGPLGEKDREALARYQAYLLESMADDSFVQWLGFTAAGDVMEYQIRNSQCAMRNEGDGG